MVDETKIVEDERRKSVDISLQRFDEWCFDIFALTWATNRKPLHTILNFVFRRYQIYEKFDVDPELLAKLCVELEDGYQRYGPTYHTSAHAANVTQTMHYMISKLGYIKCLSDLEIFAALFAAAIHDFEHQGVSNHYHVLTRSDRAILYNDQSVNENHHVSAAFFVLKKKDCNILSNLSQADYFKFRSLVIDMVLSTDMVHHFQLLHAVKQTLATGIERSRLLGLLLHACDIADSGKEFRLHTRWITLLIKEFRLQGDKERQQGLPISPCCDRYAAEIQDSQVYFLDFLCEPTLSLVAVVLEHELEPIANDCKEFNVGANDDKDTKFRVHRPWVQYIYENRNEWKTRREEERYSIPKSRP